MDNTHTFNELYTQMVPIGPIGTSFDTWKYHCNYRLYNYMIIWYNKQPYAMCAYLDTQCILHTVSVTCVTNIVSH